MTRRGYAYNLCNLSRQRDNPSRSPRLDNEDSTLGARRRITLSCK
jgi:hypothetical protein